MHAMSISLKPLHLAALGLAISGTLAQLVIPSAVPDLSDSWTLITAVTGDPVNPLHLSIQNQEVDFVRTDSTGGYAVLKDPDVVKSRTFHLDRKKKTMFSEDGHKNLTFYIGTSADKTLNSKFGQPVQLVHGKGTTGLEIDVTDIGPKVVLQKRKGQFYVCQTTIKGHTATQIFLGSDKTDLPYGCVHAVLIPKCSKDKGKGHDNLASCCVDVRDGECLSGRSEDVHFPGPARQRHRHRRRHRRG
ncbi:hypothetical protein BGZ63DRAFT_240564 [Mariannaea sp. PMI_226]|nr:hypothetical protein BGZ63DRAFT_240564 [Mariannaea sp. PMI_226]